MLDLVRKYKSVLTFIATFVGSYLVLAFLYSLYLKWAASSVYYPDYVTHLVAKQSEWLISTTGYNTTIAPSTNEPSMNIWIDDQLMVRVVEGCNAISVILLFISFVLAFFKGWKRTFTFVAVGVLLLYVMNVLRIALLTVAIYHYPEHIGFLHDILFPAAIYGTVVLLWLYWVRGYTAEMTQDA